MRVFTLTHTHTQHIYVSEGFQVMYVPLKVGWRQCKALGKVQRVRLWEGDCWSM